MKYPVSVQVPICALALAWLGYGLPGLIGIAKSVQDTLPNDRPRIERFDVHR